MGSDKQNSELTKWEENEKQKQEEELAKVEVWKYVFGFVEMAVVKCAIELGIADAIESHGRAMTVQELSSTLGCASQTLHRVMRFLANRGIFREEHVTPPNDDVASKRYAQTPLSRRFMRTGEGSMAALLLVESSPPMLAPWQALSARVAGGGAPAPFDAANGEDLWRYGAANSEHSRLFNEAMACSARVTVAAVIEGCLDVFDGVGSVVDVGGGTGTALRMLVEACRPRIRGVNFDLPHVVADAEECEGVEHVGGDMFEFVPKADAAFLMVSVNINSFIHTHICFIFIYFFKICLYILLFHTLTVRIFLNF